MISIAQGWAHPLGRLLLQGLAGSALFVYCIGTVMPSAGQAPQNQANALFVDDRARAGAAAAEVVAQSDPLGSAALLIMGQATSTWENLQPPPVAAAEGADKAPTIEREMLGGVEDHAPVRSADENMYESRAYDYLLIEAHNASAKALAKHARRDLTFTHLWEEPAKYRGQLIHIEGRLRRLQRFDASRFAAKQGIPTLYEGWIFEDAYLANPYCVVVTEVPASIKPGEKLEHRVAFDAYFFKRYRSEAGDGKREAPLLIGHGLIDLPPAPVPADTSLAEHLVPAFLTVLAATVLLALGLSWWFLRGDRQVRARLSKSRQATFVDPSAPQGPHGSL